MKAVLDTSVLLATDVSQLEGELAISSASLAELHFGVLVTADPAIREALVGCNQGGPSQPVACAPAGPPPPLPTGQLAVVPRPTLRLPGGDFGPPSPFAYFVGPGYILMTYVYDTLLWSDSTGKLVPWLAAEWQRSPDGLTYTFRLRDGVRWHDGKPLTARDVAFSFEYYASQTLPPTLILPPEGVVKVTANGDREVTIRLDQPRVTFERLVAAAFPIVPQHIWSSVPKAAEVADISKLVGTGPYRIKEYKRGDGRYQFVANDEFFLGRPFVERIELAPVRDELTSLLAGDVSAAQPQLAGAVGQALTPFCNNDRFGMVEGPLSFTVGLYWSLGRGGALADTRFRQACAHAIDREQLVKRLTNGRGAPGNPGFLPPDHPWHAKVPQYEFDPDTAKRILDEAGYRQRDGKGPRVGGDGKPLQFDLLASPLVAAVADVVVANLRAVNVELTIKAADAATAFPAATKGDYDMALIAYGDVSLDPDFMRRLYSSKETPRFFTAKGYVSEEFNELAGRQLGMSDEAQRRPLVDQMQQIVARDLPFLHLYYPRPVLVYAKESFDQWSFERQGGSPYNKQKLVTGTRAGGVEIRRTS